MMLKGFWTKMWMGSCKKTLIGKTSYKSKSAKIIVENFILSSVYNGEFNFTIGNLIHKKAD